MQLTATVKAITPDHAGFVTDITNSDGTPFIYYPKYKNIVQPDKVGMTLIVESGNGQTIERVV